MAKPRKTVKITFESINKGKYSIIDPKLIAESNKQIKEHMKPFIREFYRKMYESLA